MLFVISHSGGLRLTDGRIERIERQNVSDDDVLSAEDTHFAVPDMDNGEAFLWPRVDLAKSCANTFCIEPFNERELLRG